VCVRLSLTSAAQVGTFDIYKRDFGEATGEDREGDRSLLPKPMQVKKGTFGRAGQTKWTHLAAEDTSRKGEDLWAEAQKAAKRSRFN
jgi:microfibrillar-associated protein 1